MSAVSILKRVERGFVPYRWSANLNNFREKYLVRHESYKTDAKQKGDKPFTADNILVLKHNQHLLRQVPW